MLKICKYVLRISKNRRMPFQEYPKFSRANRLFSVQIDSGTQLNRHTRTRPFKDTNMHFATKYHLKYPQFSYLSEKINKALRQLHNRKRKENYSQQSTHNSQARCRKLLEITESYAKNQLITKKNFNKSPKLKPIQNLKTQNKLRLHSQANQASQKLYLIKGVKFK